MAKKEVLVIEDNQWFASLLQTTLEQNHYRVSHVRNAIKGMEHIDKQLPDAIVLDFFMPGPNALVLLHELQSYGDTAKIPVILCTNSASDIPLDSITAYGVVSVIDKTTMHPDDIAVALRRVL